MLQKRTDLAIEIKESFPEDDVEIEGVSLKEKFCADGKIRVSTVHILNENGAKKMNKPVGNYVTIELMDNTMYMADEEKSDFETEIEKTLANVLSNMTEDKEGTYMVSGLGNRFATPDALGPVVMEHLFVNRHFAKEFGEEIFDNKKLVCAIAPGVMSQTGMDTSEILMGISESVKPDVIIIVDALASRSVGRLCRTIQITDTGISPGAGIGNNRKKINKITMKVPVIAIGVPTVVDAGTIVSECMEETLEKQGFEENQIQMFLESIADNSVRNLFVTPKDIDEQVRWIGKIVSGGMNLFWVTKQLQ